MMFEDNPQPQRCQICGELTDGKRWFRFPKQHTREAEEAAPKFYFCNDHRVEELMQWISDTVWRN
jgi:hypothetical protein